MANKTGKTTGNKKGRPSNTTSVKKDTEIKTAQIKEIVEQDIQDEVTEDLIEENEIEFVKEVNLSNTSEKNKEPWKPDLNRDICIRNISGGELIYVSKRQIGYTVIWEQNEENYMPLSELNNLKNSDRRFFTDTWVKFVEDDEVEILKWLKVDKYYKGITGNDDIENIFKLTPKQFEAKFLSLPKNYKETIANKAAELYVNGSLDSIKIKQVIEKDLDIELDILIESKKARQNNFEVIG